MKNLISLCAVQRVFLLGGDDLHRRTWYGRVVTALLAVGMVACTVLPFHDGAAAAESGPLGTVVNDAERQNLGEPVFQEWVLGFPEASDGGLAFFTGQVDEERQRLADWLARWGLTLLDTDGRFVLIRGTAAQVRRLQTAYAGITIQPNYTYELHDGDALPFRMGAIGTDRLAHLQWGLEVVQAARAWELLKGRELQKVVVAVVDSGIDLGHPDLAGHVLTELGYNAFDREAPPEDDHGHGTHVAGVIAATVGNGEGVRGVAGFPPVKILPIKVMNQDGKGSTYEIARGIDYAVDQGVDVINLSIGGPEEDVFIREAVKRAVRKGIPVVVAAGNNGMPAKISTPANIAEALTIGAVQRDRQWLPESNYGPELDLAAPGEQILSTYRRSVTDYAYMTGTSAAAPFVTGTVALMKAIKPDLSVDAVRLYLTRYAEQLGEADDAGHNDYYGYGLLRADRVLEALLQHVDSGGVIPDDSWSGTEGATNGFGAWFPDVPDTHWAGEAIRYVVGQQWFGGYPDGTFKPGAQMKRAQAAAVFTNLLDLPLAVPRFYDIYSDFWAAYQIGAVQEMGIMTGDRGYFRPNAPLTRAQFAKVLVNAFGLSAPPGGFRAEQVFSDVRPGDWYVPYANIVAGLGLMRGNEKGQFLPNRPITRAEVAVILHRYATQVKR